MHKNEAGQKSHAFGAKITLIPVRVGIKNRDSIRQAGDLTGLHRVPEGPVADSCTASPASSGAPQAGDSLSCTASPASSGAPQAGDSRLHRVTPGRSGPVTHSDGPKLRGARACLSGPRTLAASHLYRGGQYPGGASVSGESVSM